MKKKISLALVTMMLASAIAACGSSKNSDSETTKEAETMAAETKAEETMAAAAGDPVSLTIYSPGNENSVPTKTIMKYAELVKDASDGRITLEVHHSGELGNDAEALASTRLGTIDLIFAGTSGFTEFYDPAKILDMPFIFKDADQAYEATNSEIGEEIFSGMEDSGLVFLAEGDNGMRQISTTEAGGPIHEAKDVEGLKLRVPTSQVYLDVWETLGANPVALALPELAIALSNGTAEGQDNATYHLVANATYDDIKYFSFINYMWMGCTMAANKDSWNALSEEDQKILKEQAVVAAKYSFDTIKTDNETARKILEEAGVVFDDNPDVQSFKDKLGGTEFYKKYEGESWYNQEIMDQLIAINQ
ncbi:C4-dicarboxylate ABC transporter [Lachnospiraceae bacterium]|nr:C4-dicarboxylate ABC transporter [Lachnospiraceae bacterium]